MDVIYTPWENLLKTGDMVTGQVGFKDDKKVLKVNWLNFLFIKILLLDSSFYLFILFTFLFIFIYDLL